MRTLKPGDLVTCEWEYGNQIYDDCAVDVFIGPRFRFNRRDVGLVLEVRNNNAIKILLSTGKTGWTDKRFYVKMNLC